MSVSSSSSASGICSSSNTSLAIRASCESFWLDTDTYSPRAMDRAPPMTAAEPAMRIGQESPVAPATPTTVAATDTMPSFAPRTPARSLLSFSAYLSLWGSAMTCSLMRQVCSGPQ